MTTSLSPKALAVTAWAAQILAAAILLMAGISKLAASADAVALFTRLGVEPWGRLVLGPIEVLTALLLLWPRTAVVGGLLGLVLMVGATATHLFKIGIVYNGDASLFLMAVVVLVASGTTVYLRRSP
jgi:hypothetical protein